jgi:uncharacterized protein YrrD
MTKLDLHIGVPVYAIDKQCGNLVSVVVDPGTQQVSDLIIQHGLLLKHSRVVPVAAVTSATPFEIHLNLDSSQFNNCVEYREIEIKEPVSDSRSTPSWGLADGYSPAVTTIRRRLREGVTAGKHVLGRKTGVENVGHSLGKVDHVVLERETGKIAEIVMRTGLFPAYYVLPVTKVEDIQEDSILVSISREEMATLPQYEPRQDADILVDVLSALLSERTPAFHTVEPSVEGGIIHLTGNVSSQSVKSHVEELVRLVPGVIDVENDLEVENARLPSLAGASAAGDAHNLDA